MRRKRESSLKLPPGQAKYRNAVAKARFQRHGVASSKRARGGQPNDRLPFAPPEDWYTPEGPGTDYRVVEQSPGPGYRHIVTPEEIRSRLGQLPASFIRPLEVIQLSRMTRKKRTFPCYGMQWGNSLYLYPLEVSLVEQFDYPPRPALFNETRAFGGVWSQEPPSTWKLSWSEAAIKDFYLNNVLIHELGHLLDDRNSRSIDRERYAEWFAIQYGYLPTQQVRRARLGRRQFGNERPHRSR